MITTELYITEDGRELVRTYSTENRYVVRNGINYEEAIDPPEFERVYTEGELIPQDDLLNDYATVGRIMMGEEL